MYRLIKFVPVVVVLQLLFVLLLTVVVVVQYQYHPQLLLVECFVIINHHHHHHHHHHQRLIHKQSKQSYQSHHYHYHHNRQQQQYHHRRRQLQLLINDNHRHLPNSRNSSSSASIAAASSSSSSSSFDEHNDNNKNKNTTYGRIELQQQQQQVLQAPTVTTNTASLPSSTTIVDNNNNNIDTIQVQLQQQQQIATKSSSSSISISMTNAVIGLIKAMVGSGLLALASGLASVTNYTSGLYMAHILLVVLGIISAYTFSLYGRLVHVTQAKTLGELWKLIYNNSTTSSSSKPSVSGLTVSFATFIFCFGSCIAYSLTFGDMCSSFIHSLSLSPSLSWLATRQTSILLLTTTIVLPLCRLSSLAALAPASILGVLGTVVSIGFLAYRCPAIVLNSPYKTIGVGMLSNVIQQPSFSTYSRIHSPAPLMLVAMACVSYLAHFSAPDFYHLFVTTTVTKSTTNTISTNPTINGEVNGIVPVVSKTAIVNDPTPIRRYNQMTFIGYITVAILNSLALTFGFLTFGGGSNGIILNNYNYKDMGAIISRLLVGISVICSYPFVMCSCRNAAMELFSTRGNKNNSRKDDINLNTNNSQTQLSKERRMTTILLSIITAISLIAKDAGFVVGLNGAIMGSTIGFTFPALLFLRLHRNNNNNNVNNNVIATGSLPSIAVQQPKRIISLQNELWICRSIIGFGIISSIVGGITTIISYFYPHLLR